MSGVGELVLLGDAEAEDDGSDHDFDDRECAATADRRS